MLWSSRKHSVEKEKKKRLGPLKPGKCSSPATRLRVLRETKKKQRTKHKKMPSPSKKRNRPRAAGVEVVDGSSGRRVINIFISSASEFHECLRFCSLVLYLCVCVCVSLLARAFSRASNKTMIIDSVYFLFNELGHFLCISASRIRNASMFMILFFVSIMFSLLLCIFSCAASQVIIIYSTHNIFIAEGWYILLLYASISIFTVF